MYIINLFNGAYGLNIKFNMGITKLNYTVGQSKPLGQRINNISSRCICMRVWKELKRRINKINNKVGWE